MRKFITKPRFRRRHLVTQFAANRQTDAGDHNTHIYLAVGSYVHLYKYILDNFSLLVLKIKN